MAKQRKQRDEPEGFKRVRVINQNNIKDLAVHHVLEAHKYLEEVYASPGLDDYGRALCTFADDSLARVLRELDELDTYLEKRGLK